MKKGRQADRETDGQTHTGTEKLEIKSEPGWSSHQLPNKQTPSMLTPYNTEGQ